MLTSILENIICSEFENNVGRGQVRYDRPEPKPQYAMDICIALSLYYNKGEDGYRHITIRIYGPHNYVAVLVKEDWTVIHESYLENSEEGLKPGKKYINGDTGWQLVSFHDSCWRDGVREILRSYEDRLLVIKSFKHWYEKTTLTVEECQEIDDIIRERDSGKFDRHWTPKKIAQSPKFD
jgi:hypothetical protein